MSVMTGTQDFFDGHGNGLPLVAAPAKAGHDLRLFGIYVRTRRDNMRNGAAMPGNRHGFAALAAIAAIASWTLCISRPREGRPPARHYDRVGHPDDVVDRRAADLPASAIRDRHSDVDLDPRHAFPEIGNVGTHHTHVVANLPDIASQYGMFATGGVTHGLDFSAQCASHGLDFSA